MKITVESTTKIVTVNGVEARIWEGWTDSGIPVHCYITRIAVEEGADQSAFQREFVKHAAPSPEVAAIPLRMIL